MTVTPKKISYVLLFSLLVAVLLLFMASAERGSASTDIFAGDETAAPSWMEPRPLSVVDLISGGLEPSLLANTPLVWLPGQGVLQFISGSKSGDTVTVNTRMLPAQTSRVFCLGQFGVFDNWSIVVPESRMRITSNGVDITDKVISISYYTAGQEQPINNAETIGGQVRYPKVILDGAGIQFDSEGRLIVPANQGCSFVFADNANAGGNIEIEFTHTIEQFISVNVVQAIDNEFKSYYYNGSQNFGQLSSFNSQMAAFKGATRHDQVEIATPSNANYTLMVFPPTQLDMYASRAELQTIKPFPSSGTYRYRKSGGDISVDWWTSTGNPLNFHAQDADIDTSAKYLKYFTADSLKYMALEHLALNNQYDDCMTDGGCSDSFLDTVSKTRMDVTIYMLEVTRVAPGLTQIPLRSVGEGWSPADADIELKDAWGKATASSGSAQMAAPVTIFAGDNFVYLPITIRPVEPDVAVPSEDCPCGWFTDDGRMLDYVLPPSWE